MFKLLHRTRGLSVPVCRLDLRLTEPMLRVLLEMQPAKLSSIRVGHTHKTKQRGSNLLKTVLCQFSITSGHWMRSCRADSCQAPWMQPALQLSQLDEQASKHHWQHTAISCSVRAIFLLVGPQAQILFPTHTRACGCRGLTAINQLPAITSTMRVPLTASSRK